MKELTIKDIEDAILTVIMDYRCLDYINEAVVINNSRKNLIDYEDIDGDRLDFIRYQ